MNHGKAILVLVKRPNTADIRAVLILSEHHLTLIQSLRATTPLVQPHHLRFICIQLLLFIKVEKV